jgi:nucleoside-diphosphate-sugar epimerase
MDIVIAGGHGQIALRLARILSERGDRVRGLIRNPDHEDELRDGGR